MPARALRLALERRGLRLHIDDVREVARVGGPPGKLDFWLVTDVSFAQGGSPVDGAAQFSCFLPIVVSDERLGAMLELCAWLSAGGRVGFCLDHRRPCGRLTIDVRRAAGVEAAAEALGESLQLLWERVAGYAGVFHDVADGVRPKDALAKITGELASYLRAEPWSGMGPFGTRWPTDDAPPVPEDVDVPDRYTPEEFRSMGWVFLSLRPDLLVGLQDACAGQILFHADGVVECYGCQQPEVNPHLGKTTVSCSAGMRLGAGHVCDRCGDVEAVREAAWA